MQLKNIYLVHHSHFDLGFTHSQVVIEQLQADFIEQALDLLDASADWEPLSQPRWTIEVHQQLKLWLEWAAPAQVDRLKHHVRGGRVGLGAMQYNTTPLSALESLCKQLVDVRGYRERYGFPVKAAFQHDVNGLPWVMSDLLLDAGVELFVMAVNLHTGGNGPVRPGLFNWVTPRGRTLKVFSGHHYGAFDVITRPFELTVDAMKTALDEHWHLLNQRGYPHDFLYLSTTNVPVAHDNGGPSMATAEKVREWNLREDFPRIHYVTPEQLAEKLKRVPEENLPSFRGDWNDFWNYGAGSAAHETGINAYTKQKLFSSALLGLSLPRNGRMERLQARAWDEAVVFDEHTWGYWAHALHLDHPQVVTTENYKRGSAHRGHELARYVLASRLADVAGNPVMSESEGLLVVNPSPARQAVTLDVPGGWKEKVFGRLNGYAYHHSEPLTPVAENSFWGHSSGDLVRVEVEPFSALRIPWGACRAPETAESIRAGSMEEAVNVQALDGHGKEVRTTGHRFVESEFHLLEYDPANGRILRLLDKKTGWEVLPPSPDYNLFEPIHEKPDPRFDASRKSYYDRVVDTEVNFTSCWNEAWKARRAGVSRCHNVRVESGPRTVSLVREYGMEGASRVVQRFELSADHPWIEVDIQLHKDRNPSAEAIYFVSQLNLEEGWEATYDGSGLPIRLDEEQLPGSSRSWVTTEAFTRMEDRRHQFSVLAPGMPLVQIGDFHWGKPKDHIPRPAAPLLLNWACNNYWETNYHTTQEGVIRYTCALYTSRGASNADTYRIADAFARRPLFLPLASCPDARSETLLRLDNPAVRLASIDTSKYHEGTVCRLVNCGGDAQQCTLDLVRDVKAASVVSPVEEVIEACRVEGGRVPVAVPAHGIVSVLVQF